MKLIKIGAAWCGPCNAMDKQLEGFDACEFVKYDVDNSDDETLKVIDEYKIRSVPVIILLRDGMAQHQEHKLKKKLKIINNFYGRFYG